MIVTLEKTDLPGLLFQDLDGFIEIREIDREEAGGKSKPHFFASLEEFKTYTPPLDKHVYVGMFSRSRRKGNKEACLHTWAIWADFDGEGMSLDIAKEKIASAGLPEPSVFVSSGKGIHSYWLLTRSVGRDTQAAFEGVLRAIVVKTGADPKAAEIARTMRLPGTFNVKVDVQQPCEILEVNEENRYPFELFTEILDVNVTPQPKALQLIAELEASNMACIRLIAKGVGKGQRNFALGKITAFLKRQGLSRKKVFEIVQAWNENNHPPKPFNELQDQFNRLWDGPWQFLGCRFANPDLERINKELCPIGECVYHAMQSTQVINGENAVAVDNEIFKDTVYRKMGALEIACYSWITREKEVTKAQLSKYVNRHVRNENFIQALRALKTKGLIEIQKGTPQSGIVDKFILKSKSNYGRGYTLVPNLLTKLYTKKGISDNAFKLMVLLKHYSFGKGEVFPTIETMASKLGISERWVTELLKWLDDDEGLIQRSYKQLDNGKTKLIIKLLY